MTAKTVAGEAHQVKIAIDLIELGARLQLLQEETSLSRERLLRLYKEIKSVCSVEKANSKQCKIT